MRWLMQRDTSKTPVDKDDKTFTKATYENYRSPDYFPGKGCDCEARSSYECGCEGADWTPKEVYDLRGEVMALKAFAESTAHLAKSLKAERDEARAGWDQEIIFTESISNLAKTLKAERNEAQADRENSRQSLGFALEELNEIKENLDEEMKFHHRTHAELVNANCRMLDMQNDNSQLADRLTELELHSTSELARLEQELADAREEAHRFRSLYYAKSGINKSASAFPWEDAK